MPSASERKLLRSLRRRKGRLAAGLFIAEGPHLVGELLAAGLEPRQVLYTARGAGDPEVASVLETVERAGIAAEEVPEAELRRWADTEHPRGVLAVAPIPRQDWQDLRGPGILVLDGVQDPGNVGTLVRTADALGAGAVVTLPGTADVWSPKVARAAAGSTLRLPVLALHWSALREALDRRRYELWAATVDGDPLGAGEIAPERLALVLGSEGSGVSDPVRSAASRCVTIPLEGGAESLNVAAAGAILMDRLFGGGRAPSD